MKKQLFYNIGRLLDDGFEEQFRSLGGEVLLLECKTRDQNAIVMSNNEGGEDVIKLGDIKKCFVVHNDYQMVCFVFKKNKVSIDGKCCKALAFFPSSSIYRKVDSRFDGIVGRESHNELEFVLDFVSNYFNGLQPLAMENIEDIRVHGFQFQTSKVLKDLVGAIKGWKTWSGGEQSNGVQFALRWKYMRLYHSYVHFLQQKSCARDFKILIRRSDNLPKLFKEEFGCESPRILWVIVLSFIVNHHCLNENVKRESCPKVSYLKCLECGFAYYCSKECQIENWPMHKSFCQRVKNIDLELGKSREVIHRHIMKQSDKNKNGDSPPTFKIFRKEIERALFTTYFDVIEHTNHYDNVLNKAFGTKSKSTWMENLQALRRNRYKRLKLSSKKLESQLISVYGTKSVFSL